MNLVRLLNTSRTIGMEFSFPLIKDSDEAGQPSPESIGNPMSRMVCWNEAHVSREIQDPRHLIGRSSCNLEVSGELSATQGDSKLGP